MIEKPTKNIYTEGGIITTLNACSAKSILNDLNDNGTTIPDIMRVIYNMGSKTIYKTDDKKKPILDENGKKIALETYPVLTTIVYFADGSKSVVTSSKTDNLTLENGEATFLSKEIGFIYAVMKRILAGKYVNSNGITTVEYQGFGRILSEYVKNSYDCQKEEEKTKLKRIESKKRYEESKKISSEKKSNPSLAKTVKNLSETIEMLKNVISSKNSFEIPVE